MNLIYALLLTLVIMMWVWSVYLQRELTVNNVSLRVGDSFSWVLASMIGLGVITIILANVLALNGWKIFLFLICMMAVDVVILWLTATWVHATTSHKIPLKYRVVNKKREDGELIGTIIISVALLVTLITTGNMGVVVAIFVLTPILVIIERTVSLKKRVREIQTYDTYTEEEVKRATERLQDAIKDGKVLKPKDNVLKKVIKKEKARYQRLREIEKSEKASQNMENIKRKNDTLHKKGKDDKRKGDDVK